MPICPSCYKMSGDDRSFCSHCGASLDGTQTRAETIIPQAPNDSNEIDRRCFLTPSGAGIAAICFFLPWVKLSCAEKTFSGADIGGIFWIVFIAALTILGFFFFFKANKRIDMIKPAVVISAVVALGILIWKFFELQSGVKTDFGRVTAKDIGMEIQFGAVGTVIGFIISYIGSLFTDSKPLSIRTVPAPRANSFCGNCGARMGPADIFCPECGTDNRPDII